MSTTAEDISSALISAKPGETSDDKADAIAALLVGEDESEDKDDEEEATQSRASSDSEDEESNEEGEAEEDVEEETTLDDVADNTTWENVLGVSEDKLSFDDSGNVAGFRTKVNGQEEIVSAEDLIAGYQNNKSNTVKSQAHAEAVKAFEVQKEAIEQEYSYKLSSVDALTQHFEKQLISEYDGVDWGKLRAEDPAEYAAARHDFSVKASELTSIKEAILADKQASTLASQKDMQAKQQEYLKNQYTKMLENNPEWVDETVRKTAENEFKTFIQDRYGFTDADWSMVTDARLIELVKDAKKYRDGVTVAEKKRSIPVPKFQKSRGKGVKPKVSKLEKLTAASRTARGADKRDLQQSAVAELLLGGS
jgi:hypothetical protein